MNPWALPPVSGPKDGLGLRVLRDHLGCWDAAQTVSRPGRFVDALVVQVAGRHAVRSLELFPE